MRQMLMKLRILMWIDLYYNPMSNRISLSVYCHCYPDSLWFIIDAHISRMITCLNDAVRKTAVCNLISLYRVDLDLLLMHLFLD